MEESLSIDHRGAFYCLITKPTQGLIDWTLNEFFVAATFLCEALGSKQMFNDTEKYFMIFLCVCLFIGTQFNLRFQKKNHYRQCQRPRWTNKIYFRNTSNPHCLINCALSCSFTIQKKRERKAEDGKYFCLNNTDG